MTGSLAEIGPLRLDPKEPLFILGPCVIESEEFVWRMARALKEIAAQVDVRFVFKASYDKANRTSVKSYRGLGVREGCAILAAIGKELNVPVTTDVHTPEEIDVAAEYIDILQIPAFLCRQTDLIKAAAETGRVVNVKKGQFLAPWDVKNIAEKLIAYGNEKFFFTERGTTFGYNNLVADMRSLYWIRELGYPIIFDATHSVQRPGGGGDKTSGDGVLAPVLARAAMAAGCDGIFIETHENPAAALSDGPNQIRWRTFRGCCHNCATSMPCSSKTLTFTACAALVCLGAATPKPDEASKKAKAEWLKKQGEKKPEPKKKAAKAPEAKPADKAPETKPAEKPVATAEAAPATPLPKLSVPLPVGQDSLDVTIPYKDTGTGKKTMNFKIGVGRRIDEDHLKMKDLQIETFDETGASEMTIALPGSVLDLNTRIITGTESVTIKRSDFQLTGKTMTFNTETRQGWVKGEVKMIIYDLSEETGSQPAKKKERGS